MPLRMWSLDVAREQCLTLDHLYQFASMSLDAGYDTLGLYLEHRFAYPSVPWAQGSGVVTPEQVRAVRAEFPSLKLMPMINVLGHMEGFLNCEHGVSLRETRFKGMQACPSNAEFKTLSKAMVDDVLQAFDSEWIHLGGDETWELSKCPECSRRSKARVYADHFGALLEHVADQGRRPAIWGDMCLEHLDVIARLPKSTVLFDWQYFSGLKDSAPRLAQSGHDVVGCPSLQCYNAAWMHVNESEANVREVSRDADDMNLAGVCLTTWEQALFGAYDTLFPAIKSARRIMDDPDQAPGFLESYSGSREWARLMGTALNECGGVFAPDGHRHRLKGRLLLYGNPFLAWMHHADELCSSIGTEVMSVCDQAILAAKSEEEKGVTLFVRAAVEFVRMAEAAHRHYASMEPELAIRALAPCRHAFDTLEMVAKRTHARIGGSLADIERCRVAKKHVETVIWRIQKYGRGELGYCPSFDILTNSKFVPHDQACWWAVNKWGDE